MSDAMEWEKAMAKLARLIEAAEAEVFFYDHYEPGNIGWDETIEELRAAIEEAKR